MVLFASVKINSNAMHTLRCFIVCNQHSYMLHGEIQLVVRDSRVYNYSLLNSFSYLHFAYGYGF